MLRDIDGHGRLRPQLTAESMDNRQPNGAVRCFQDLLYTTADRSCEQGSVRKRLRARLVQRSCVELEAALERRHGDKWADHVLRGDFHTIEGMHRICEAFSLRLELEQQVLKSIADHARTFQCRQAEALSILPGNSRCRPMEQRCGPAEGTTSYFPIHSMSESKRCRADSLDTVSTSDGDSIAGTLDDASSEAAWGEEGQEMPSSEEFATASVAASSSGGSSSECETASTIPSRVSWRSRALKTLGLQRLWPGYTASADVAATPATQEDLELSREMQTAKANLDLSTKSSGTDEEEMEELESRLVAAVCNAELHATTARAERALRHRLDSFDSLSSDPLSSDAVIASSDDLAAVGRRHRQARVHFARQSEVFFFSVDFATATPVQLAPTLLEYRCPLQTKVFDGPSGHKARRTTSSDIKTSLLEHEDEDEHSTEHDEEEDEAEEWEDRCDDIAELMGQERSCMLWSACW